MSLLVSLFEVCENGELEKVKSLVEQGVNIHEDDDYALQIASEMGHLDIIDYIITNYGNKKSINNVLFWASISGNLETVKNIIQKGADIYAENDFSLKYATSNGFSHIIKYLFSLYEHKEYALKIILSELTNKNDLSMVKGIIDNHNLYLNESILEEIKENNPVIYDYFISSKEIELTQNSMSFDIR